METKIGTDQINSLAHSFGENFQNLFEEGPLQSLKEKNILEKFAQHLGKLKTPIQSSEDLLVKELVISSPANKNIVYTVDAAFNIIVTHEWRHQAQAKELNEVRTQMINL